MGVALTIIVAPFVLIAIGSILHDPQLSIADAPYDDEDEDYDCTNTAWEQVSCAVEPEIVEDEWWKDNRYLSRDYETTVVYIDNKN